MPIAPNPFADHGDAQVMARIGAGDSQALVWLYRRDSARVMRYCLAIAHDEQLAADALQDTFVSLATAVVIPGEGFDADKGSLVGYLLGIARHHLLAALRKSSRFVSDELPSGELAHELATDAHLALDPMRVEVTRQSVQALMAAVAVLPFAFREAVVLVDLQELSYDEAARIANVPLNTLRTRLHRGRNRLSLALAASPRSSSGNSEAASRQR